MLEVVVFVSAEELQVFEFLVSKPPVLLALPAMLRLFFLF